MENIFTPEYIPYYVFLEKEGLISRDIKLFGFIYFYITSTKNRFYFTNEQLAKIINSSKSRVSNSVSSLVDLNLIITSDHGMDTISNKTAIFLDSYIDISLFEAFGSRACYSLFLKNS
jgi:predicted AlkP superfamily pyrophosphatase or phosphodiesterase